MKKLNKYILVVIIFALGLVSCEKEITIKLPDVESKFVIEGSIENDAHPTVIITKSSPYLDPIDYNTLLNSIVTNAKVFVTDGVLSDSLKLKNTADYPFFYYSCNNLVGEIGKRYYLTVEVDGQTFSAETTIQNPVIFDSIWYEKKADEDSVCDVFAIGTDDGSVYNYYRVFTKILSKDISFVPILGSVWDDKFFNGKTFTVQLYHGMVSNIYMEDEEFSIHYKLGDTVVSKLCTLDYESYKFWSAAESEILSGSNPFTTTTSIPSNIKGGAIGCWTGYCATFDTIICNN
mgnify:CR=1 FL=1